MANVLLDRNLEEQVLDNSTDFVRRIRQIIITDLDVTPNDPLALEKALTVGGVPQLHDLHPSIPDCRVVRHIFRGLAGNQVKGQIIYETPTGGSTPTTGSFFLRDSTTLTSELTEVNPVTGFPLLVKYTPSATEDTPNPAQDARVHSVQYLVPMRVLSVVAIINDRPNINILNAVGAVNNKPWQGLPKGYWLCVSFTGDTADQEQSYRIETAFMTRLRRDWSSFITYKDDRGQVPANIKADDVNNLMNGEYLADVFDNYNGIRKSGLYPEADFQAIFGLP